MEGHCLNCGHTYMGNFCPQCGQKKNTHKFTLVNILHEVPHSVFHVDKGFPYTFKELIYRPGNAIREYISGKRVTHFSPFAYLLILCTIRTFVDHRVTSLMDKHYTINPHILFPEVGLFFKAYPALMLCLLVPFLSFWSWLFNRQSGYTYWENFVMNVYLMAQFNVFFIASKLITLFTGWESNKVTIQLVCFVAYLSFAYWQFFPRRRGFLHILNRISLFVIISLTLLTGLTLTGFMTRFWW